MSPGIRRLLSARRATSASPARSRINRGKLRCCHPPEVQLIPAWNRIQPNGSICAALHIRPPCHSACKKSGAECIRVAPAGQTL